MLTREVLPGMFVLVDEDTAWRDLLLGVQAVVTEASTPFIVKPGSNALCLVEDLSIRKGASSTMPPIAVASL
jgi:hypothetical protein